MRRGSFVVAVAAGLLAGCGSGSADLGPPPPPRQAMTTDQIRSLPPEAQRAAQNAARAGDYQAQRMREMAEAQRRAGGH